MSRSEKLNEALRVLKARLPEVLGSAIVSTEGFIEAAALPNDANEALLGEMSAALFAVGGRVASELLRSTMEQTYVRTPNGYIIVHAASTSASLVLLVSREARLGLIFLELKRITHEIVPLL